ncbi:hypothetical protein [Streptomyces achromogenes]|uniref:hypothetical protein n=1 Tax=Streptomyces achromogenes TaxID=67255 RepID=UPI0036B28128
MAAPLTSVPNRAQRPRRFRERNPGFVTWLARRGRRLSYSVGMVTSGTIRSRAPKVPASAWTPAVKADGELHDGAWVTGAAGCHPTGTRHPDRV